MSLRPEIRAVLFDFGGVLAEEGFKAGLSAIAEIHQLNPSALIRAGFDIAYETGFVTGRVRENVFWRRLREQTGIHGTNTDLTEQILSRFIPRPRMLKTVSTLKKTGIPVGILSDQTHWLDELNARYHFFHLFDYVFNSYHLGMTKKDPAIFDYVLQQIDCPATTVVFVDDHYSHVERAVSKGLCGIHFTDVRQFLHRLNELNALRAD